MSFFAVALACYNLSPL